MPSKRPRSNVARRRVLGSAFRFSDAEIAQQIAKREAAGRLQKARMVRQYINGVRRWRRREIPFEDNGTSLQFSFGRAMFSVQKDTKLGRAYKILRNPKKPYAVLVLRLIETPLGQNEKHFVFRLLELEPRINAESVVAYSEAETKKSEQKGYFHYTSVTDDYKRERIGTFLDYERTLKFLEEGIRKVASGVDSTNEAIASADYRLYDNPGMSGIRRKNLMTLEELESHIKVLRAKQPQSR